MNTDDLIEVGLSIFCFWAGTKVADKVMESREKDFQKNCEITVLKQRLADLEKAQQT